MVARTCVGISHAQENFWHENFSILEMSMQSHEITPEKHASMSPQCDLREKCTVTLGVASTLQARVWQRAIPRENM